MADTQREARVLLTGDASGLEASYDRARDAQGRFTKSVKDCAGETGNAGKKNKDLGDSHDKAGEKAEKHSGHLKGLHKICHALNEIYPGLGVLMQAAFTPVGAAVTVALMVLRLFHEKLEETKEAFKELEEEAAKPMTHRMDAIREGTVRAAEGMAEFGDRLHEARTHQQNFAEATQVAVTAMHDQFAEAQSLGEATMRNELARLDQVHSAGVLSEEQYASQKLEIEQRFQQKKRELQEREAMTEILIRRRAVEQAGLAQPGLEESAKSAMGKKEKALEDLGSIRTREEVAEDKKKAEGALKDFAGKQPEHWVEWFEEMGLNAKPADAAQAISKKYNLSSFETSRGFKGALGFRDSLDEAYDKWVKLTTAAKQAEEAFKKQPADEAKKKVAADQATREADLAMKRAEENQGFITEAQRDLGNRQALFDERHRANAEMSAMEGDTVNRETATGRMVTGAGAALTKLRGGGKFDFSKPEDVAQLQALMELANTLSQLPASEKGKAVAPSAAGQVVSRELGHMTQGAVAEAAMHGKSLGDDNVRLLQGLQQLLANLRGNQARILATVESSTGNEKAIAQRIAELEKAQRQTAQQVRYQLALRPGEG